MLVPDLYPVKCENVSLHIPEHSPLLYFMPIKTAASQGVSPKCFPQSPSVLYVLCHNQFRSSKTCLLET